MKDYKKYYEAIVGINAVDEQVAKRALEKAGLYSKTQTFPLASLQLELTSCCNAACKHCYNNSGNNNQIDAMTPQKWIDFAKYIVNRGGVFECLISGGEPFLLGEKLFQLMDIFHEDGTLFLLQTNGSLINEELARRLKKYRYHWLQISIDGVNAKYHDEFRQKNGLWEKAINAALCVAANDIPLKIAHCVTPHNLQEIDDMCSLAFSLGASAITVGEICLSGRAAQNPTILLSKEQRQYLYQKVEENRARYRGKMIVKSSNSVRLGLERQSKAPSSAALIRPNGDVRIDGMAPFVIGNILREDFAEMWEAKIEIAWKNAKVQEFIANFDKNDRNYAFVNFMDDDIFI